MIHPGERFCSSTAQNIMAAGDEIEKLTGKKLNKIENKGDWFIDPKYNVLNKSLNQSPYFA